MTAGPATAAGPLAGRVPSWLRRRDPGLVALCRAGRVTVAACAAFYAGRFLIGDATVALYGVFAAISLGVLSDVTGSRRMRTRLMLGALPVGLALVTLGTLLAGQVWAAAAGMLVVGFAVAYSSVAGPRVAGLANGLQLFYILPCFPPYDPGSLPERLAGLALGIGLLAVADRMLWPAPTPRGYADRLAEATEPVLAHLDAVLTRADPDVLTARHEAAVAATRGLRLNRVPRAERPVGPGVRDRSLTVAAAALQSVTARLAGYASLAEGSGPPPAATDLLLAVEDAHRAVPPALRGTGPTPDLEPLDARLRDFLARRARLVAADEIGHVDVRCGAAAVLVVESARSLVVAVRAAVGAPVPAAARRGEIAPATFAYLTLTPAQRWWRRLRAHLDPHSVHFQNAVRLALGLAAARVVADLPGVSHGFWVLLATLTLMRTSLVASRAALVPAFVGVTVGAVVAGLLLTVVGAHSAAYVVVLPVLMVAGLAVGPLFGPAAGQAGFTVVIAVLFAQLAPATWRLAEARLLDVVLGGLVGALIGAAVWPRGGAGEVRRSAGAVLRRGAGNVVASVRRLTGTPGPAADPAPATRLLVLLDATHAQYLAESDPARTGPDVDWLVVLGVVHRLVDEADLLCGRHPPAAPLPWPDVSRTLEDTAQDVARGLHGLADALASRAAPGPDPGPGLHARLSPHPPPAPYARAPADALRVIDAWGWLHALADDLSRLHGALGPGGRGGAWSG